MQTDDVFGCWHQEIPTRTPYLGNELLERLFASDAGSVLALLGVGFQSSRVTSSKDRHELNALLAQPTLLYQGLLIP